MDEKFNSPNEGEIKVFTKDEVFNGIQTLADVSVFGMFRSAVQDGRGIFSTIDPEITTYEALNLWINALVQKDRNATKLMWDEEDKIQKVTELAKNGLCQKILIAYWGVGSETPWNETENHISDRQLHLTQQDFPNDAIKDVIYSSITSHGED